MTGQAVTRRLAAILAADVVGFSRMMGQDEEGTLARLKRLRAELIDPTIAQLRGRIFKTTGDGLLVEFPSVVDAVQCAARVQAVLSNTDVLATTLMSDRFLAFSKDTKVGEALGSLRSTPCDRRNISYLYIVLGEEKTLAGLVDLRDLVTAREDASLGDLMVSPVVSAERDCLRHDLAAMFAKYQFRILPVVDTHDHLLGVVRYKDLMKDARIELPT